MGFDTINRNGSVVVGAGASAISADLGIQDGKIAKIGDLSNATDNVIDATDQVVTPGLSTYAPRCAGRVGSSANL